MSNRCGQDVVNNLSYEQVAGEQGRRSGSVEPTE